MMLILEIFLTVTAWRNGWKAMALAPLGVAIVLGMMVGGQVAHGGMTVAMMRLITIGLDLLAIAALGAMTAFKPEKATELIGQVQSNLK